MFRLFGENPVNSKLQSPISSKITSPGFIQVMMVLWFRDDLYWWGILAETRRKGASVQAFPVFNRRRAERLVSTGRSMKLYN